MFQASMPLPEEKEEGNNVSIQEKHDYITLKHFTCYNEQDAFSPR